MSFRQVYQNILKKNQKYKRLILIRYLLLQKSKNLISLVKNKKNRRTNYEKSSRKAC